MEQSGFKFSNPIVSKINYVVHPSFQLTENNKRIKNTFETHISRDKEDCKAIVELNIKIGDMDQANAPFFVDLSIQASFKWEDIYTEDTVQSLLSINAPALLLTYARPMVATITSLSPYPSYNIPFYNFTK